MPTPTLRSHWPTKVATLTLPTREASVIASVWPTSGGTLILLAELNLAPTPRAELATTAQATLERCLNDITIQTDVETSLEKAALALNQDLKSRERLFGNPLAPRYHFCLAVLRSNLLALANIGYLQAFVAAPNRLTDIFSSSSKRRQGTQALFQHIVSGQLEPGETLVLTSPSLTEFFTQDKLRQLFSLRTPGLALREAEQIINSLPHHPPLGVIALKLEELPSEQAGFQPSLEHLLQTKDDTSSLLKPKLWSYLKKRFSLSQRRKPPEKLTTGDELPAGDYSLTVTPEPEATALAKSGTYHPDSLRNKLARTASQLAWLTSRAGVKTMVSYWLTDKIISWRRLSYAKRVLLVLATLVLVAFSQSIVSLGRNQLKSRDSENYNQLVASLTEQQAVVEAAVIYHDDAKAQLLLNQAYELLAQLPQNTSSRKQQRQTLARNLDTLARRLRHQAEATTAEPWLELPGGATWRYLGLIGNSLYALSAGGQIAPLDLDGKIGSIFTLPTSLDQPLALTPLDQQYFLAWGNNGSALIDLTSRRSTMMPKIPALFDAASYDHRLYYISQKPMAIFRTTRQDTDFATPVRWLKPSQGELQGARSLTVDGAIYVATASQVQKYVLGLKRDFTLQPVEPPLQDVTSLKTAGEGDHLYLTEPALKRLVVYDKQGKLVLQLSFPNLPELTSLTYDPINKYMYVLSGSKIYRLKLTDYLP